MPGPQHEAIVELLRSFPEFTAEILRDSGLLKVPRGRIRVEPTDLGEAVPVERRADLVLSIGGPKKLLLILEVQLGKDPLKRGVWPATVVAVFRRTGHPTALVVLTTSRAVETWAALPITVGPGFVLRPVVIGPSVLPPVTSSQEARDNPTRAVLSALIYGRTRQGLAVGRAAVDACLRLDAPEREVYLDLIFASLNTLAKRALEKLMVENYEFQSDFFRSRIAERERISLEKGIETGIEKGIEKGIEAGRHAEAANAVLRVLAARALAVNDAQRARVMAADLSTLERWLVGAATASSAEEALV